jgi:predicted phage baseplate assembly protein
MPLDLKEPTFDRPFDDIFRELRGRIPRYNPAWTNFNDGDPGITLLQLFAWLAEMTFHRMGDMPRKNYLKFAELLGMQLAAARPALVRLAFTPKPAEPPATIPARSRFSAQVEGSPKPIVFETTQDLDVIGAPLDAMLVFADGSIARIPPPELPATSLTIPSFYPFGRNPEIGSALYLGFKPSPANPRPFPSKMRFLALRPEAISRGAPQRVGDEARDLVPPVDLVWEYRPRKDQDAWERLNVFDDKTVAFTRDGYVDVEGPAEIEPSVDPAVKLAVPEPHYWLRVRLDALAYPLGRAPRLDYLIANAVDAVNMVTEEERLLGTSNGRAGQTVTFPDSPIEPDTLSIEVRVDDASQKWRRVDDFHASDPDAEDYVLDATAGRVTFGDGAQGRIPPAGAEIVATAWRHGGGSVANRAAAGAVKTMITQVAGIEKVTNPRGAAGGADEEDIAKFMKQAPARVRNGNRAVTERDFESLAMTIGGVGKARALGGRHPDYPDVEVPGAVTVLLVADSDAVPPTPSSELIRSVCKAFENVRLLTTEVHVSAPAFLEVRVEARLFAAPEAAFDRVAAEARKRLDAFLNPIARKFGENISPAAIYAQLFGGVDPATRVLSVENLLVYVDGQPRDPGRPIEVPPDALVYPGHHLIVVRPDQDERTSR